ncbi:hypothetical protein A3L04_08925 [Thermococcus chitonophagus]|uniref:Putative ABC transport ATP-binding subunit n=1 Tax=Thermococcus chitonophagus TaxID=54262 RepID=A0A160VVJ5_9EURY|nr:ATP-binding cassette domain-containing protein [Thermococcus chitonophagus]ASJ17181.1 hypothetical protein A3L04_08925 [Thermococcus chitonophagus]CUX77791.1 putative ABC transport ATP-binding subunit [Thermococcus chitonophagus]
MELLGLEYASEFYGYQLSGGMAKAVLLGMALIQRPQVLVLDEPTSMIDVATKFRIWNVIENSLSRGVLIASHDINEVKRLCNRIYVIVRGRIVASGTPAEISRLFKMPTEIRFVPTTQEINGLLSGIEYWKSGNMYEVAFKELSEALSFVQKLVEGVGVEFLELSSPSFEKVIMKLVGGGQE